MSTTYVGNELVKVVDELHICGCGCPEQTYKVIHDAMKDAENKEIIRNGTGYYDFLIYQLNYMGFLNHGITIYGSWVTEKGQLLMKALDEMYKYGYNYLPFFENNLVEVEENEMPKM